MTLSTVTALAKLFGQYLLQPIPFTLTFLLPLLFRLIARKYIWLSSPLDRTGGGTPELGQLLLLRGPRPRPPVHTDAACSHGGFRVDLTGRRQKLPVNALFLTEDRANRSTAAGSPHRAAARSAPSTPGRGNSCGSNTPPHSSGSVRWTHSTGSRRLDRVMLSRGDRP